MSIIYDEKAVAEARRALDSKGVSAYAYVFSRKMNSNTLSADERGVYAVLYAICSVDFSVKAKNPFGELNLDPCQTQIAIDVYPQIADPLLRSRVADAAWTVGGKCVKDRLDIAKDAIDAYSKIQIDAKRWFIDGLNVAWERGLRLAKSIGTPVEPVFSGMKVAIKGVYEKAVGANGGDDYLRIFIPSLLCNCEMLDVIGANRMAQDFENLAQMLVVRNERQEADKAFQNAFFMRNKAGNEAKAYVTLTAQIENALLAAQESETHNDISCAHIYDHALRLCLRMPTKMRSVYGIEKKIKIAKEGLHRGYLKVAATIQESQLQSVDISSAVEAAANSMIGLDSKKALQKLATLVTISFDSMEESSFKGLQNDLSAVFYSKCILRGARVVATVPPWSGKRGDARHEYAILEELLFWIQCYYETTLSPAFDKMKTLYDLDRSVIEQIVNNSTLIPEDHRNHFTEGLMLGVEGRFSAATAMLCPEIENIVRVALALNGCDTSSMGRDGILQEVGLSNMVVHSELDNIFGKDVSFELREFFCDHRGVNMRNAVAHGLKSDELFNSAFDFYVWWFSLRLALRMNPLKE